MPDGKPLRALAAVAILGLAWPRAAPGWNDEGHMLVAAIAYDALTPEARGRVDALLRKHPECGCWRAGGAPELAGKRAFMRAAIWPDEIKQDPRYVDDPQTAAEAGRNLGFRDTLRHGYWHYKDLPFSPDGTPLEVAAAPNAETQLAILLATLASDDASSRTALLKAYDLAWLIHLVADVHQPLHATSRFTAAHPRGDRGGNDVIVRVKGPGKRSKKLSLHSYWDELLGTRRSTDDVLAAEAQLIQSAESAPAPDDAAEVEVATWLAESEAAAEEAAYAPITGPATRAAPFDVTPEYGSTAAALAAKRVRLAGARLAAVLNADLR